MFLFFLEEEELYVIVSRQAWIINRIRVHDSLPLFPPKRYAENRFLAAKSQYPIIGYASTRSKHKQNGQEPTCEHYSEVCSFQGRSLHRSGDNFSDLLRGGSPHSNGRRARSTISKSCRCRSS